MSVPVSEFRKARLSILGNPAIVVDDLSRQVPAKSFCLLAFLAMERGKKSASSLICDLLWENANEAKSRANLRQMVRRVRQSTNGADWLELMSGSYSLGFDALEVDLWEFLDITEPGQPVPLERLLQIWKGELLEGLDEPAGLAETTELASWVQQTRSFLLRRLFGAARSLIAQTKLAANDLTRLGELLTAADPYDELGWEAQIEACRLVGDVTGARRLYQQFSSLLAKDGGAEPSIAMRDKAGLSPEQSPAETGVATPFLLETAPGVEALRKPKLFMHLSRDWRDIAISGASRAGAERLADEISAALAAERNLTILYEQPALQGAFNFAALGSIDYVFEVGLRFDGRWKLTGKLLGGGFAGMVPSAILWTFEFDLEVAEQRVGWIARHALAEIELNERDLFNSGSNGGAYKSFLDGLREVHKSELADVRRARQHFNAVLKHHPEFVPALAGVSRSYLIEWLLLGDPTNSQLHKAVVSARRCIDLDPRDFRGFHRLAHALLYTKQHDEAMEYFGRAVDLNPHNADLLADYADAKCYTGDSEDALSLLDRANAHGLNSRQNRNWIRASIQFVAGDHIQSIETFDQMSGPTVGLSSRAASWALLGEKTLSKRYAERVKERNPFYSVERSLQIVPYKFPEQREEHEAGLRLAGLL